MGLAHLADDEPLRVAYAIGTRTGNAVIRNRLRRRLRAVVADLAAEESDLMPSGVLLISAGPEAVLRTTEELTSNVIDLLEALRRRRTAVAAR